MTSRRTAFIATLPARRRTHHHPLARRMGHWALPPLLLLAGAEAGAQATLPIPTLPAVQVNAPPLDDATSEGRGRYAAPRATIGGKDATPVRDIPASVSVITRQRIEDQGLATPEQALGEVTGVTVTPWDGATSQIRSRGYFLEPSHDGIPSYGGLNATQQFDLAMYDRIEVLRGPAGLFQGAGQPGGTVNFARRMGLSAFGGSFAASTGSWANHRVEADVGGPLNADGSLRSRLVLAGTDRDFYYDRAHSRRTMAYGTLDYDVARDTTVSLYAAYQDDRTNPFSGLPAYSDGRFIDLPRSTNPYPSWAVYDTTTAMAAAEMEHRWDGGWKLRARYRHYRQDWDLRDSYPTTGINPATGVVPYARRGWDTAGERHALDIYASGPFTAWGRQHQFTAGWSYEKYSSDTDYGANDTVPGVDFLQPDTVPQPAIPPFVRGYSDETVQSGLYTQARLQLSDAATLVLGARAGNFRVRSRNTVPGAAVPPWTPGARESGEVTPSAGLVYRLTPATTAYASYADIFMPQTQRESGTGRLLDPRVGKQVEIGTKSSFAEGRLLASAAIFRTRDENRAFADPTNPGFFLPLGEVQVQGWEAELSGSPLPGLQMSVGYARLDTKYLRIANPAQVGTPATLFEPRHTLKAYAHYHIAGTPWSVGGGAQFTSGILGTGVAGLREQGGYGVFSAQVGYQLDTRTSLSLAVSNLLDRNYYARVGGLNSYNTYGEPRSVTVGLRTAF